MGDIELKHNSKGKHSNDGDQGNTAVNHDINCNMLATAICQREWVGHPCPQKTIIAD